MMANQLTSYHASQSNPRWESLSQRVSASQFAKRVFGPSSVRKALKMTLSDVSAALEQLTGRHWSKATLCKFEQAHDGLADWARHGASRFLRSAYELLITTYIETRSRGKFTARVTGTRIWRITLVEVTR